jgi:hypothetical protein
MTDNTREELDYILDTFAGADGGIRFIKFQALVEELDRQHQAGGREGYNAGQVLDHMTKFKKFIELAQGGIPKGED